MVFRPRFRSLRLLSLLTLIVGLSLSADGQAQKPNNSKPKQTPPMPKADPPAPAPPANEEVKFEEAEQLRKATTLLLAANHDYGGHCSKAIDALKPALKILDAAVMKHGTAKQKEATAEANAALARAEEAAKATPVLRERHASSDKQLKDAKSVLEKLRPGLVAKKQDKIVGCVNTGIAEISTALGMK